jgi:prepilin-type N-terminal cleavage/methylation domain-containing protein
MSVAYQRIKQRREAEGLNANAGFTLIELLIVIVVLGILAGVVIFALGGITGKSAKAACQADGATISTAISAFNAQNPGTTVTEGTSTGTTGLIGVTTGNTQGGPYLQSWPSNLPHYAFTLAVSGVTYTGVTTPTVGELLVDISLTSTTVGPFGNVTFTTNPASGATAVDQWAPYTGPSSCALVQ